MRKFVLFGLLLAAGLAAQDSGFYVFVKVSPCSVSREDWIIVARANPTGLGGSRYYESADRVQGPSVCVPPDGCTFEMAMKQKALVAAAPLTTFRNYCCKDFSVALEHSTQKLSVFRGWTGVPGFTVVNQNLCCEEASAMTGVELRGCPRSLSSLPPSRPPVIPVRPPRVRPRASGIPTRPAGTLLGCFRDTSDFDLNGSLERSRANTPQRCIQSCRQKGFPLAAVQYGESCLCGDSYGLYGNADNCNMACAGDPSQICGGPNANMVFATGLPGASVITTGGYRPPPEGASPTGSRLPPTTIPPPTVNPPTRSATASKSWALVSTTVTPEKQTGWSYTAQAPAVQIQVYNGDRASFQWTQPPQQFDASGFTISLNAQSMPAPKSRLAVLLCVGSDRGLSTVDPKAIMCADPNGQNGAAASKQQNVQFKPDPAYDEMELRVELMWRELTYKYTYRKVQ